MQRMRKILRSVEAALLWNKKLKTSICWKAKLSQQKRQFLKIKY